MFKFEKRKGLKELCEVNILERNRRTTKVVFGKRNRVCLSCTFITCISLEQLVVMWC